MNKRDEDGNKETVLIFLTEARFPLDQELKWGPRTKEEPGRRTATVHHQWQRNCRLLNNRILLSTQERERTRSSSPTRGSRAAQQQRLAGVRRGRRHRLQPRSRHRPYRRQKDLGVDRLVEVVRIMAETQEAPEDPVDLEALGDPADLEVQEDPAGPEDLEETTQLCSE